MLVPWASLTSSPGHYSPVCTHQRAEKSRWEPSAPSPPPLCGPPVPTTSHHLLQAGDTTQHVRAVRCLGLLARARPRCQKVLWVPGSCDLRVGAPRPRSQGLRGQDSRPEAFQAVRVPLWPRQRPVSVFTFLLLPRGVPLVRWAHSGGAGRLGSRATGAERASSESMSCFLTTHLLALPEAGSAPSAFQPGSAAASP